MSIGGGSRANNLLFRERLLNEFTSAFKSEHDLKFDSDSRQLLEAIRTLYQQAKIDLSLISEELCFYLSLSQKHT
ncbi:hypothetical protein EGC77_13370 [Shewanella psychromarinicola]|uniref:Uncharacterized protein n=1 Tax=Shewanella psychromarinicola TaxID=2487742 RepID=A0A3N4EAW9_9GAMM|nr:hypothetical protein EGC77_13370 [Shewanella psychromarinicola]